MDCTSGKPIATSCGDNVDFLVKISDAFCFFFIE